MNARNGVARRISRHLTTYRLPELTERRNRPVWILEHGRPRDEDGRAGGDNPRGVVGLDAAVDLELRFELLPVQRRADRPHFVEAALDELLSAKARMHAHHKRQVEQAEMRQHGVD